MLVDPDVTKDAAGKEEQQQTVQGMPEDMFIECYQCEGTEKNMIKFIWEKCVVL